MIHNTNSEHNHLYHANVTLFCMCGWVIELFNGETGFCKNPRCRQFGIIKEVIVNVTPVDPDELEMAS